MNTSKHFAALPRRYKLPLLAAFALLGSAGLSHAAVTITSNVTFNATLSSYTYSYTVSNSGTGVDLAVIDIPIGPTVILTDLTAPSGFGIISDGDPVSLVSFFEDNNPGTLQTFGPDTSVTGFSFVSTAAPSLVTFSAMDANGDTFTGTTQSAVITVPEPSPLLLLGMTALPLALIRCRRSS